MDRVWEKREKSEAEIWVERRKNEMRTDNIEKL